MDSINLTLYDNSLAGLLHHDTQADNLLMEVDADVLHGSSPCVEAVGTSRTLRPATIAPPVYHVVKELPKRGVTSVS
jgi:hypothetical protein